LLSRCKYRPHQIQNCQ